MHLASVQFSVDDGPVIVDVFPKRRLGLMPGWQEASIAVSSD
jgi:hypothetical protein